MKLRDIILRDLTPEPYDIQKKYEKKIEPLVEKLMKEAEKIGLPITVLSVTGCKIINKGGKSEVSLHVNESSIMTIERRNPYIEAVGAITAHPGLAINVVKSGLMLSEPSVQEGNSAINTLNLLREGLEAAPIPSLKDCLDCEERPTDDKE